MPKMTASPSVTAEVVGSKALGLMHLARLGLPVPPAFVLGTALCREYFEHGRAPEATRQMLAFGIERLQEATGREYGGARRPLLLAVRSGAPVSMPGMMETILNVGLAEQTLPGFLRATGNPRQVRDCYRRLVRDFTEVVHGASPATFDRIVERHCNEQAVVSARALDSVSLARIVDESLELALASSGEPFPQDPMDQLLQAVEAVWRSWNSSKAREYRRLNGIDDAMGTAVTVQAMVFGNSGANSGAGVGFTRDPATGDNRLYFDFLFNAQGEDVVTGRQHGEDTARLGRRLPQVAAQLERLRSVLESELKDVQDFEFTVENGQLYLLQTRAAKRTPWAALRIAVDLVREGTITPVEALTRLEALDLDRIERTELERSDAIGPLADAVSASIGVAAGRIVFDSQRAAALASQGSGVILARPDIHTADIEGIAAAAGVLTSAGGRTSHAAVVARQLGRVCLVDCRAMRIDPDGRAAWIGDSRVTEGDEITIDAEHGAVYAGRLPVVHRLPDRELAEVARWRAAAGLKSQARG
jgi:pyruvate, orthophosphate dikinase